MRLPLRPQNAPLLPPAGHLPSCKDSCSRALTLPSMGDDHRINPTLENSGPHSPFLLTLKNLEADWGLGEAGVF